VSSANWYLQSRISAYAGNIKIGTNAIKAAWFTHSYTPNLQTDAAYSGISANESTGSGYTAGGNTLTSPTLTATAANSWGTTAAINTAYTVGQIVKPSGGNLFLYRCEASGTSGGSAPTWPTVFGATVADGTVTWTNVGTGIVQFTGTVPTWTMTCTDFRYLVFYDSVTSKLIACHDTGSTQNVSAQLVTYTPDATGIVYDYCA
jgi:hypothetical protein